MTKLPAQLRGTLLPLQAFRYTNTTPVKFLTWLEKNNQNAWQFLPFHQTPQITDSTQRITSPYSSYGIGFQPKLASNLPDSSPIDSPEFNWFLDQNRYWLTDYALFTSLSQYYQTDNWTKWPLDITTSQPKTIQRLKRQLQTQIFRQYQIQFALHNYLQRIKRAADQHQIYLIGDLPFYISLESPLVWQYQQQFLLNRYHQPTYTSGVRAGKDFPRQTWGHPLYNWSAKDLDGLLYLWTIRLQFLAQYCHVIRIDHSIGFYKSGKMHPQNPAHDRIINGPGTKFIQALIARLPNTLHLIFEDLTDYDDTQLHKFMNQTAIPGQLVITQQSIPLLTKLIKNNYQHPTPFLIYTSTHDTVPLLTWIKQLSKRPRNKITKLLNLDKNSSSTTIAHQLRDHLIKQHPDIIIPLQDWMVSEHRINTPGTVGKHNWDFKFNISDLLNKG